MLEQFEEFRNEIRENIVVNKDYDKAINQLFDYIDMIKSYDKNYILDDYWFAYYNLALTYRKNGDFKNAFKFVKMSIPHYLDDTQYFKSVWLLIIFYENTMVKNDKQMIDKIIRMYQRCLDYYKMTNNYGQRISVMFNMAKLKGLSENMALMIKLFDKKLKQETPDDYFNSDYKINYYLLKGMCEDLINSYMQNDNIFAARLLVKNITNMELKSELKHYIKSCNKISIA